MKQSVKQRRPKSRVCGLEEPGVFETMRSYNGRLFKFNEHLGRLFASANSIGISLKKSSLKALIESEFKKSKIKNGSIRVAVDRKSGIDIIFGPQKIYPKEFFENGVEIVSVPVKRNSVESQNPKIKSRDFLWGVMAKLDHTNSKDSFEAILLNENGYITEGTVSNIFIVKDNELITPPGYCGVLEGITRGYVIELARKLKVEFKEDILTRHDIYNADEAFLTNTSMEIMPVVKFDERTIGSGRPGKITKRLIAAFTAAFTHLQ